ncbi:TPA: GNAT family N-acetyltransferase [Candidatus Woesearchaeota archaeon]|nr:GNAT family N-acetyltransferase [Candidatus Woesearchaeota archaeon]
MDCVSSGDLIERLCGVPYSFDVPAAVDRIDSLDDRRFILSLGNKITWGTRRSLRVSREFCGRLCDLPSGDVGFVQGTLYPSHPRAFHVVSIGVEPAYEGRGYASKMLDWVEEAARALRMPEISVESVGADRLRTALSHRGYHDFSVNNFWRKRLVYGS